MGPWITTKASMARERMSSASIEVSMADCGAAYHVENGAACSDINVAQ